MKQLTSDEAIALYEAGSWRDWTDLQRAAFQLVQDKLCMPFDAFHRSMIAALGRPVWTHEFADRQRLAEEVLFRRRARSMEEILQDLPAHRIIVARGAAT